jgi:hypothetical protein
MTVETFGNDGFVITGDTINTYRLMMLWKGLVMETKGFRISSHRPSAYSIVKKEFSLKGSKLKVLDAFELILRNDYGLTLNRPG